MSVVDPDREPHDDESELARLFGDIDRLSSRTLGRLLGHLMTSVENGTATDEAETDAHLLAEVLSRRKGLLAPALDRAETGVEALMQSPHTRSHHVPVAMVARVIPDVMASITPTARVVAGISQRFRRS
jgi:hypothetical protein